jgi:hypothetical protein
LSGASKSKQKLRGTMNALHKSGVPYLPAPRPGGLGSPWNSCESGVRKSEGHLANCCLAEQRHKDRDTGKADHRTIRHPQWDLSIAVVGENGNRCKPFNLSDGGIWIGVRESPDTRPCAERHRRGCRTHTVHLDSDLFALKAARKDSIGHTHLVRQSPSAHAGHARYPNPYRLTITTTKQDRSPPRSSDWSLRNNLVRRVDSASGFAR